MKKNIVKLGVKKHNTIKQVSKRTTIYAFLILMIILNPINGNSVNPSLLEQDDSYTHQYFSDILNDYSTIIGQMVQEDPSYLNNSILVYNKTKLTQQEIIYYQSKNITSPSMLVIGPFYNFSNNLNKLCELNYNLINDLNENTTNSIKNAKLTVVEINDTIELLYNNLDNIDNISNLKQKNNTLYFNTSNIRDIIKLYIGGYEQYKNIVDSRYMELPVNSTGLYIKVSNEKPALFDNIIIYGGGGAPNTSIELTVGNNIYEVNNTDNIFSMNYSFNETGYYEIYATQKTSYFEPSQRFDTQNNLTSNVVVVEVSKIPTYILTEPKYIAFVNKTVRINGVVVDKNDNPVDGYISENGKYYKLNNGKFSIIKQSNIGGITDLPLKYNGTSIYQKSNKSVEIEFLRYPVNIVIETKNNNKNNAISKGENIEIVGQIYTPKTSSFEQNQRPEGANDYKCINIFVNNTKYATIQSKDKFDVNISINNSGNYIIYATYGGDNIYAPSKSNEIRLFVEDGIGIFSYLLMLMAIILIILIYFKRNNLINNKESSDNDNKIIDLSEKEEAGKQPLNIAEETQIDDYLSFELIEEAYKILFGELVKKYNISKQLTPRELLFKIKENYPELYPDLNFITAIHEKITYERARLDKSVKTEYFEKIKKILGEL
ncbi:Ig-like domain-containing protein [Methanococcus aeolicus]|uniref:Ig-like domain-containing protein n=1 Tax=Methanococcus aeolicus TaxID=42879 RepID=UPI0021C93F0A|nr:Ig-like domain-containing protein [Methanococcus aeolicus]UXM85405.1 Ig-like domain-containing protein [Methanococcus aeolicus]